MQSFYVILGALVAQHQKIYVKIKVLAEGQNRAKCGLQRGSRNEDSDRLVHEHSP
jgi:hypothetical protein